LNEQKSHTTNDIELYRALFRTVLLRKRTVVKIVLAASVFMFVYVLIMPQTFTSTVSLLPPQKEQNMFAMNSLLQGSQSMPALDIGASLGFGARPSDLFVEILKSHTVADSLILHEKLDSFFGIGEGMDRRHALEPLQEATDIEVNKNGVIRISVSFATGYFAFGREPDSIRNFAARVANQYVVWLDRVNREKLVSRARNSRIFIEQEVKRTQADLDSLFVKFVEYQQAHRSVFIDKQMEAALAGATSLREKLMDAQVELGIKKKDFAQGGKVIEQLQSQIDQLSKQYNAMSTGEGKQTGDYFVPFANVPSVTRDIGNFTRQVRVLEQVIAFLRQQYYQDRVQEVRDVPTVQVLDQAVPAIKRTSPHRALWMLMTVFFSTLFSVVYIMLDEYKGVRKLHRGDMQNSRPAPPLHNS
jgi:tyrosine-protein kinase Etk/Wzc